MPAKNLYRVDEDGIYSHIYNKGIENRAIFKDEEDFEVFLGFLRDYLTPPKDPKTTKKSFRVNGRTFWGTPHQPKNYYNKVELIAYSLFPDHFHLLLQQKIRGSLENFIRSLLTRYSMYFNKKYKRSGSLFEGPYKSIPVKKITHLPYLTYLFHKSEGKSSYLDYIGPGDTIWLKGGVVLRVFEGIKDGYQKFIEGYVLNDDEREILKPLTFENDLHELEGRDLTSDKKEPIHEVTVSYVPNFLAVSGALFILLFSVGLGNIKLEEVKNSQVAKSPIVLGETSKPSPAAEIQPAEVLLSPSNIYRVETGDNSPGVNIRLKASSGSEKIGKAKNGDLFESVSQSEDWVEIKLDKGSTGFISKKYLVREGEED